MTEEAQQKIRSLVEMAMSYVVEPQPLSVPAVPETLDALVEQLNSNLNINGAEAAQTQQHGVEEAWDGEAFGVRLACKPPAEPKTVIGMVDALAETCFRLAGFVDSIPVKAAGQTYKREIQILSNDIFLATAGLFNEFLDDKVEKVVQLQQQKLSVQESVSGMNTGSLQPSSSSSRAGSGADTEKKDGYLVRTGIVWEACEIFEKASRSNRQAVAKKWNDMVSTMEDAIAEVQQMIDTNDDKDGEVGGDEDGDDSGNESDDSWNNDDKMTEEEKQLSIRANSLLKLTRLLFKKLQQRCLDVEPSLVITSTSSTATTPAAESTSSSAAAAAAAAATSLKPSDLAMMWDQLYDRAKGIVALADEIATSLYSPQVKTTIVEHLQELSRKNHDCILVGRLFIRGQVEHERWMDMCEAQAKKILDTVV
ncbi:hypothetical protein BGX34_010729 [Mortierella sp. NVP85]|nr:hypothetical protein BGX34_010729 [Mortierella sp. NVP85]